MTGFDRGWLRSKQVRTVDGVCVVESGAETVRSPRRPLGRYKGSLIVGTGLTALGNRPHLDSQRLTNAFCSYGRPREPDEHLYLGGSDRNQVITAGVTEGYNEIDPGRRLPDNSALRSIGVTDGNEVRHDTPINTLIWTKSVDSSQTVLDPGVQP